ncbi:twin-arginine translocation signal domain-containing protein [Burkholderia diffusa]|uniref:twin-arginine translocation signal domain-containing protein n=1 Tax=Burkholderia TaxID=32008 RepID=UPI002445AE93|nr:twin-arginine translocation signal domain-containing protein [Burkholderia diffusa]
MSRRDFIGWTGALAGGAVLGGLFAATRAFAAGTVPNAAVDLTNVTIAGQAVNTAIIDKR